MINGNHRMTAKRATSSVHAINTKETVQQSNSGSRLPEWKQAEMMMILKPEKKVKTTAQLQAH